MKYKIAVLLTCHNRSEKTLQALESLREAVESYNHNCDKLNVTIFLTDDGCTDGTSEKVKSIINWCHLMIVESDGNAYWAGGMRLAWKSAIKNGGFDYYLLLNDDAVLFKNCFADLLATDNYCRTHYHKGGVYTAFLCDPSDHNILSYGAEVYTHGILSRTVLLKPTGSPQMCLMPNANILLVSKEVTEKIGPLDEAFVHGAADWDYGIRASKAGFPVLTTSTICGACKNDSVGIVTLSKRLSGMSLSERRVFLNKPTIYYTDGFTFNLRYNKVKYFAMKIAYFINLYCPRTFYKIAKLRGHK